MSVLCGHAVMDENGGINGAIAGDQTGKEITTRRWYVRTGGWQVHLIPKDKDMAEKAAHYMELICANNNYGYSQPNRWSGYNSIKSYMKSGYSVEKAISKGKGDWDCSSLVIGCYIFAGLNHPASGYTGSMAKSLYNTKKFFKSESNEYIGNDSYAVRGSVYVGKGHTLMCLENGKGVQPDTEKPYVLIKGGSVVIRTGAGTVYPKIGLTAHRGEKYPFREKDGTNGWYWIDTPKGVGCISNRKDLTELVI